MLSNVILIYFQFIGGDIIIITPITGCCQRVAAQLSTWPVHATHSYLGWKPDRYPFMRSVSWPGRPDWAHPPLDRYSPNIKACLPRRHLVIDSITWGTSSAFAIGFSLESGVTLFPGQWLLSRKGGTPLCLGYWLQSSRGRLRALDSILEWGPCALASV